MLPHLLVWAGVPLFTTHLLAWIVDQSLGFIQEIEFVRRLLQSLFDAPQRQSEIAEQHIVVITEKLCTSAKREIARTHINVEQLRWDNSRIPSCDPVWFGVFAMDWGHHNRVDIQN